MQRLQNSVFSGVLYISTVQLLGEPRHFRSASITAPSSRLWDKTSLLLYLHHDNYGVNVSVWRLDSDKNTGLAAGGSSQEHASLDTLIS